MTTSSKKLQFYITLTCYIFLGFGVFCPVFRWENIPLSLFFCMLTALLWVMIVSAIFKKPFSSSKINDVIQKFLSIPATFFSAVCILFLMTEVIRDTCYIVGKGVSREYYVLLSAALLGVSLYLCFNSEKGIYRFTFVSIIMVLLFVFISVLPLFTIKEVVFDLKDKTNTQITKSIAHGCASGLFLACDTAVFLYCFGKSIHFEKGFSRLTFYSVITSLLLWCIPLLCGNLIFGKNLISTLSDPLYALTKAHRGFDITELLSALRIFAFIIKSSVYAYSASLCLKNSYFSSKKHSLKIIVPLFFATIPCVYLPFLFMGGKDNYGKLQEFVYTSVIILSLIFVLIIIFQKKEK